jgi:regulator of sigma E protease
MHNQFTQRIVDPLQIGVHNLGILVFLLVLTLVVTIHEFGHYLACRAVGIHVNKFAIGFGEKKVLSYQREGGTEWSLRPWPLGGFIEPNKFEMASARPLTKAFVALAGPLANLFPFGLLGALTGHFSMFLKLVWILYVAGVVGIINTVTLPVRWLFSIPGIGEVVHTATNAASSGSGDLVGPIGLGHASVQATNTMGLGLSFLFMFTIISLGLALINLVPILPLDGGRVALAGVEAVVGKKRIGRVEKYASYAGGILMLLLFLIITTADVIHLF